MARDRARADVRKQTEISESGKRVLGVSKTPDVAAILGASRLRSIRILDAVQEELLPAREKRRLSSLTWAARAKPDEASFRVDAGGKRVGRYIDGSSRSGTNRSLDGASR